MKKNIDAPKQNKTETWQEQLNGIENYKTNGTIIRSKEKNTSKRRKAY